MAVVGETPYDYFNNRRLRIAVERLKSLGDERLIDLALDLGYDSHSSFTRAFKARFGLVPLQICKKPELIDSLKFRKPQTVKNSSEKLELEPFWCEPFSFTYKTSKGVRDGSFFTEIDIGGELEQMLACHSGRPASAFPFAPIGLNDPHIGAHYGIMCKDLV